MIRRTLLLFAAIVALAPTTGFAAETADALFERAHAIYSDKRKESLATAQECLEEAGKNAHQGALYNLFVGYQMGYLGEVNFPLAARYRTEWLRKVGTPESLYLAGLGSVGAWLRLEDVKKGGETFIFTGARVREVLERLSADRAFVGINSEKQISDPSAAVKCFEEAIISATERPGNLSEADKAATAKSFEALSQIVFDGEVQIPFPHNKNPRAKVKLEYPAPKRLPALVVFAGCRGVPVPPIAFKAAARYLKNGVSAASDEASFLESAFSLKEP